MDPTLPEYSSFAALASSHVEGRDFRRVVKQADGARIIIVAPHGGRIEPYTDTIAMTLAGVEFSLYCFSSNLPMRTANLHITSHRFDDPACLKLIEQHELVVAVHGWAKEGEAILIGGRDAELAALFAAETRAHGVATYMDGQGLGGTHPLNICNRGLTRRGVQVELTMALRRSPKIKLILEAFRNILLQRQHAV